MSYDTLLTHLGEFGPYHRRLFLLLSILPIFNAFHGCSVIFNNVVPDFRCAVPDYNDTYTIQDRFHYKLVNATVVYDNDEDRFSQCLIYGLSSGGSEAVSRSGNESTQKCQSWVYDRQLEDSSLVAEFDLVCDRQSLATHFKMCMMLGLFIGSLLGGTATDILGRKKAIIGSLLIQGVAGVAYAFSTSVVMSFLLRFLLSLSSIITFIAAFVLLAEVMSPQKRTIATMGTMFGWVLGMFIMEAIYYLVTDWRIAQIIISAPAFLVIVYWWLLPESPRWLMLHNRTEEAEAIIRTMAKVNQVKLPGSLKALLAEEENGAEAKAPGAAKESKRKILLEMCTSRILLLRLAILSFNWAAVNMVYFGLTLNVGELVEGSIFFNFLLLAVMELIAYSICVLLLEKVGRKKIYCVFTLSGGLACVCMGIPLLAQFSIRWVDLFLYSVGKLGITGSFAVVYIVTAELLPTGIRNFGLGFCSFMGRIGGLVSPYIATMQYLFPGTFGQMLPLFLFGLCAIIAGLTALTLPETRNRKLPDTIAQAEAQKSGSPTSKPDNETVI